MNKLRKKIFWTILIILSVFLITILIIFNYQDYHREEINIKENLSRMNLFQKQIVKSEKNLKPNDNHLSDKLMDEERYRKFFDAKVYTILLDDDNKIIEIISHTEDEFVDNNIKKEALKIIDEIKDNKIYIGNLYFSNCAYKYEAKKYVILIDTSDISKRLISSLEISILLFILAEIIIVIISKMLSEWIIKPVEESFNKQKQFIADASHELKTPLSVIMACAETLENNPKEEKWLETIKSESNRMNKLITSLLDLAKVENEKSQDNYQTINLSKLVEKSILLFESLAYEKDIKLDYEINDNIQFKCNSEQISELLSIILDNAIKHSLKKGNIMVNLKCEKDNIILEVINKGDAIPKGEESKIFERFYRVDKSRNRNENRYGLGLAIAKSIVDNHLGTISAFSSDQYTTFKIIFKKVRTLK